MTEFYKAVLKSQLLADLIAQNGIMDSGKLDTYYRWLQGNTDVVDDVDYATFLELYLDCAADYARSITDFGSDYALVSKDELGRYFNDMRKSVDDNAGPMFSRYFGGINYAEGWLMAVLYQEEEE